MTTPTMPSAQAPVAMPTTGAISREWFVFLSALLAVVVAQDARIAALEAQ
jgi:hypothetical protein